MLSTETPATYHAAPSGVRSARIGAGFTPPANVAELSERFATSLFRRSLGYLFDPDMPREDPNALLKRMGGRINDPAAMNHQCPSCDLPPMKWALFAAHALPCYVKHRKVVLDITKRKFGGGSVADARVPVIHMPTGRKPHA